MHNIHLSTLILSGLLLTSCGPTATPALNSNSNVAAMSGNTMNANMAPQVASGTKTSEGPTFTAAEVATHNTESDCYAIVAGNVYDLSKWVNRHPGGPEAIMNTCGKDISELTHPGGAPMSKQVEKVTQYKVGSLAQ